MITLYQLENNSIGKYPFIESACALRYKYLDYQINFENFVKKEGHGMVPSLFKTNCGHKLGGWVQNIRHNYKKGRLSPELKTRLVDHNLPSSSKTFIEGEPVHITGTFRSNSYAPNQFVFAAQAEHVETGQIDYVDMSQKTNVTKKKSVDVDLDWTPKQSGEYILKLYVMDATTMGAVLKDPIINNIYVEPANTNLASGPESTKN